MNDKTLGMYKRTTPDPDETTGEALARLQAEMTRLLDEADAELRDEADGGVAAALIEQEVEQPDAEVRELRSALARELARGNALQDALDAAESRPLTPDAITDEMVERARNAPSFDGRLSPTHRLVREMLTAALTEPPARPEGAEEVERLIETSPWHLAGSCSAEADWLAEHGVRVVSADGAR